MTMARSPPRGDREHTDAAPSAAPPGMASADVASGGMGDEFYLPIVVKSFTSSACCPGVVQGKGQIAMLPVRKDDDSNPNKDKALECLADTSAVSFTASPATIRPGHAAELSWQVTSPKGCQPQLLLNNSSVHDTGTMSVQPTATTSYHLVGQISSIQRTLGTVTVTVDTSQCFIRTVSEATVRDLLHSQFASALAGTPLSQRHPPVSRSIVVELL